MIKLLLDQNISFKAVSRLKEIIPGLTHVKFEGLENAEDNAIWHFAKSEGYCIITYDSDFSEIQTIKEHPPTIIWLRFGNLTKTEYLHFMEENIHTISDFLSNKNFEAVGCLEFK